MMVKLSTELSNRNGCVVEKGTNSNHTPGGQQNCYDEKNTLIITEGYSGQYGGYQIDESENEVKSA